MTYRPKDGLKRMERYRSDPEYRQFLLSSMKEARKERIKRDPTVLERERLNTKKNIQRLYNFVNAIKAAPCVDCHMMYKPWIMEFDHVRGEKLANVSKLVALGRSIKIIKAEIEKCDIVCSNCHAERTHKRLEERKSL